MAAPITSGTQAEHADPKIFRPRSGKHEQSFIVLHGRGSNGSEFGQQLLWTPVPGFGTLQAAFPNAKFIFPTALRRRVQAFSRVSLTQWFDVWSLTKPAEREELQFEGLRESTLYVHELLRQEIAAVGAKNVVLWGLSQGWATSMPALLLWQGEALGATVGMCSWLPLRHRMQDVLQNDDKSSEIDENEDIFESDGGDGNVERLTHSEAPSKLNKAIACLRELLDMQSSVNPPVVLQIPVFIGHGTKDEKIPVKMGKDAANMLEEVGFKVEYKEYPGLMHWYSEAMLGDIVLFLGRQAGFSAVASDEHV